MNLKIRFPVITAAWLRRMVLEILILQFGAVLAAFALEEFLVPNHILDGGVTGVSIIINALTHIPLALWIFVLNLPFLFLGVRQLGIAFLLKALYAIASLSAWVAIFYPVPAITKDLFLSAIFGGMALGAGVGIILRMGGCLDGTEIIALLINKRIPLTVGQIVMFINIFIFGAAAFVFGIDKAMYSVVTYLVAYRAIDMVVEGLDESKAVFIVSGKTDAVADALTGAFRHGVTILNGRGGYSKEERNIVYVIVRRLEINKVKDLARSVDPDAFITVHNVHEVVAKNVKKGIV